MKKLSFYLTLTLLSLAIVLPLTLLFRFMTGATGPAGSLAQAEQAVYSAALISMDRSTFLIAETTQPASMGESWSSVRRNLPGLSKTLYSNYVARNRKAYPVSPDMKLDVQYYVISNAEVTDIFLNTPPSEDGIAGGPFNEMSSRYPGTGGLTRVSRVGFNWSRTKALVGITLTCGSLCAYSYLISLEKLGGIWQVKDKWLVWIS